MGIEGRRRGGGYRGEEGDTEYFFIITGGHVPLHSAPPLPVPTPE